MSSNNENGRNRPLTIEMSQESYDVIMETLAMDLDSSFIDEDIKEDIEKAVNDTRIKSLNPFVTSGILLVSECCHAEALYTISEDYGIGIYDYCKQCLELTDYVELDEEGIIIFEAENKDMQLHKDNQEKDKIHPEDMPTCHGCGGQKEHPTKEFLSVPDNGLCSNELNECNIEEICVSCATDENVCSCWNCNINLCIDCDVGEMRTDLDGHTYCNNCEVQK